MTLVALFAMTAGAWAEEATITLKCGTTEKTYENVTLPWSTTADILKQVVTDIDFNIAIQAISGGDGKVVKYGNENFTVTGTFSGEATVTVTYNTGSSATITVTAPAPLITLNEAKTEATMAAMPAYDATVDYELVRDMSIQMTAQVGDGTQEQPRYRVKKDGNKFIPADMEMAAVPALFTVNDAIEQKALTLNQDYFCLIYKLNEQTLQPIGDGVMLFDFDFAPGLYAVKAVAADGSDYDGETALSNTFQLFQGYEVTVAAKEFITYYKDEPLRVEDEAAELYTISSVNDTQAVLSQKCDAMPSNTPMLVYNNSDETKVILLIPCNEPDLALTVAPEFQGTLTGTTIAASTENQTNYALNGKAFVYVKNAIEIGPNKAWLQIPSQQQSAHKLEIVFDGNLTGVDTLNMKRGTLNDDSWYTVDGRKLQGKPTTKGVYILNGRKVVIK